MSDAKQTAADEGPVASRTRRQTEKRTRDEEEEKQPAQSSAHVSPAMRIYRHALESILSMLQLRDLSRALAVSREWSAAVRSMKSIDATIERGPDRLGRMDPSLGPLPSIESLVVSPLIRHIAAIRVKHKSESATPLTSDALALLAQHAPNLTSLWCSLTLTPGAPLSLPLKLTSLELTLVAAHADAEINGILTVLTALPLLLRLHLRIFAGAGVDLGLLAVSRSLTNLTLEGLVGRHPPLSDAHVEQIRSSLGHLARFHVVHMDRADLPRLLQPPHTARWQDIGLIFADPRTGNLLETLPTLTKLELYYDSGAPHADFLSKLPLLSALRLHCWPFIPAAPLLASLLPCIGLTELDLGCKFNSAQVSTLLATLTKLRKLKLWGELESLQCFASGPATCTLEELDLRMFDTLPHSEVFHLSTLKRLRSLQLWRCFTSPLDEAAIASLCPPSASLPSLTQFYSCWLHDLPDKWEVLERKGPSFEWMQSRLTQ